MDTVPHSWFNYTNGKYEKAPEAFRVRARCESIKEETLQSGFLTMEQWNEQIDLKAQKYMKTGKVRKMVATRVRYVSDGLREGDPVSPQHLIAIILYCDFAALCTSFSETYRKKDVFESLESVAKRHSHWWWLGRILKESVHHFGTDGESDHGPYFCGLNVELYLPLGGITIYGPCSTTTARDVALNFSKSEGIVVKINTDGNHYGPRARFFDCSWISNYFEEAERLFLAEKYPLRIDGIIIVRTAQTFSKPCAVFFILKTLVSGWRLKEDYFKKCFHGKLVGQSQVCIPIYRRHSNGFVPRHVTSSSIYGLSIK